jgi:Holliday junction resolvasome RuvABC endonuclease subunit
VVGLDLSLTSTGMSDGFVSRATQTGKDNPIESRLKYIRSSVGRFVSGQDPERPWADLVVIEAGAFSRNLQTGHEELAALRYLIRVLMTEYYIPFAMVPPTTLKAYTAGHGKATKSEMVTALYERHGVDLSGVKVKDGRYDIADATALAAMGYEWLGEPLPTAGPPPPRKSLVAVQWPAVGAGAE